MIMDKEVIEEVVEITEYCAGVAQFLKDRKRCSGTALGLLILAVDNGFSNLIEEAKSSEELEYAHMLLVTSKDFYSRNYTSRIEQYLAKLNQLETKEKR
jgi:hypothetical protein